MTKNTTSAEASDRGSEEVLIKDITVDPKYQTRVDGLDEETVEEYRAIYAESPGQMMPIVLVRINGTLYLVAGFQRIEAAKRAGCESIRAIVIDGDEKTAMREALGSNKHGLRLSNGDKKKSIIMAVQTFPNYSNGRIAELIGCSESYVRKVKESEESPVRTSANPDDKVVGKDDKPQARHKKSRQTAAEPSATPEESAPVEAVGVEVATTNPVEPQATAADQSMKRCRLKNHCRRTAEQKWSDWSISWQTLH